MTPLTPQQLRRVTTLALDYEARRLFPTPAECRAAAERMVRDEDERTHQKTVRSVRTDAAPTLF